MSLYLAKFFHRPPGDGDRLLLLILTGYDGEDLVMTIALDGVGMDQARRECASAIDAIIAFRAEAERFRADGFIETEQTKYTLRELPPDPQPKPAWQVALDELMLAHLARIPKLQAMLIEALATTPARDEPLYLWLAADHRVAEAPDDAAAAAVLAQAEVARDALAARVAADAPFYAWSLFRTWLEGAIHDVLCDIHLAAGDPAAALDTLERAREVAPSGARGARWAGLLCLHFPARKEEAFDEALRHSGVPDYDDVRALPSYAQYERRVAALGADDPGWRWGARGTGAAEETLRAAEQQLGAALPPDYRGFLAGDGHIDLLLRMAPARTARARFYTAAQLAKQRDNLLAFITMTDDAAAAAASFRERFDVALDALVPIAEPADLSRALVIHLGPGARFGWCWRWDHDDPWELEAAQPSFAAALTALTDGIACRDRAILSFLGIYLD